MNRRRYLQALTLSTGFIAGCNNRNSETVSPTEPATSTDFQTTEHATSLPTGTELPTPTDTPQANPDTIFVGPNGSDSNPGTKEQPLKTVQTAIDEAKPGETVFLQPGIHTSGSPEDPVGITKRAGEPDNPITIKGPPEAVVRGPVVDQSTQPLFFITHSHIHLKGMTLDGLTNPDLEGDPTKYREGVVSCSPPTWQKDFPDYLRDVKIKPSVVGNARRKLINAWRTNNLEIGGFEVVGTAGADYFVGNRSGYALGAIVSLGRSSNNFGTSHYPWDGPDQSHNIRIHHIANLAGHTHTEFVKLHAGNYDVTVEYCTNQGGNSRSAISLPAGRCTVRWCDLRNGGRNGLTVKVPPMRENASYEQYRLIPDERFPGVNNAIYGNRLLNHGGLAVAFESPDWFDGGPHRQRNLCHNKFNGETEGLPGQSCPPSIPEGDGIGHTGGESPWA